MAREKFKCFIKVSSFCLPWNEFNFSVAIRVIRPPLLLPGRENKLGDHLEIEARTFLCLVERRGHHDQQETEHSEVSSSSNIEYIKRVWSGIYFLLFCAWCSASSPFLMRCFFLPMLTDTTSADSSSRSLRSFSRRSFSSDGEKGTVSASMKQDHHHNEHTNTK